MKLGKLILSICILGTSACATKKHVVTYDFPEMMKEPVLGAYIKQWEKGKILYGMNCAKCHNQKEGKRDIIPDFTNEQLVDYELRIKNTSHESNITESTVTPEELGLIVVFLTYKKKNESKTTKNSK